MTMKTAIVSLKDKNDDVQYGLNWGQREKRDPNQSYLQLTPEVYKSDFFPIKGKYFIVETDDNETLIMTRAQKDLGCALQTPENNALLGTYIRRRLGVPKGAEIVKEDLIKAGVTEIQFIKLDNMHYRMKFGKENFMTYAITPFEGPLQQVFFGAPGTGKSHTIKEVCKAYEHYRITFHPDTDYASFVGAYKPFTETENLYHTILTKDGAEALPVINPETTQPLTTAKITYKFVQQAFIKAYVAAWREQEKEEPQPVFLVIEEINRGNCAQIFGDIFQLLDRNEEGFSDYPIHADTDLCKELGKVFADLKVANADTINALYDGKDVVGEVKKGTQLLLPNNLYIWATMNTSDQSLFPIDSAFKRRWDWRYIKIADSGKGYVISVNDKEYDWWQFLQKINEHIGTTTSQEDKKLGYFFAKATKNADGKYIIPADKFLSKVLFFLYGDVYKDYGFDDDIFKGEDGTPMEFSDYFDEQGHAIEDKIEKFLMNLGLEPKATESEITEIEDAEILESEDAARKTTGRLTVEFPDGTIVKEHSQFDTYLKALQKIGLDKVFPIAAQKQYVRRDEPLISKIQSQRIIDDPKYSYVQSGDYYIIKGIDLPTQINFLKLLSQSLDLGLNVYAE